MAQATRRYENRATVVSINKVFAEWKDVFPNAACVVTLVDRLIHRAEIITIDGVSRRCWRPLQGYAAQPE